MLVTVELADHSVQCRQCLKFKIINRGLDSDRRLPGRHSSMDLLGEEGKEQEISRRGVSSEGGFTVFWLVWSIQK